MTERTIVAAKTLKDGKWHRLRFDPPITLQEARQRLDELKRAHQ